MMLLATHRIVSFQLLPLNASPVVNGHLGFLTPMLFKEEFIHSVSKRIHTPLGQVVSCSTSLVWLCRSLQECLWKCMHALRLVAHMVCI